MSNRDRVTHVSGYTLSFGQVQKRIAQSSCFVWVTYGKTFRNATFQEAAQMRKEQAKLQEPIPFAELPGLIFKPAQKDQALTRQGFALLKQANQFCQAHA